MPGCSLAKRKIRDPLFCKAALTHHFPLGLGSEYLGSLCSLRTYLSQRVYTCVIHCYSFPLPAPSLHYQHLVPGMFTQFTNLVCNIGCGLKSLPNCLLRE